MLKTLRSRLILSHFVLALLVVLALLALGEKAFVQSGFEKTKSEVFQTLYVYADRLIIAEDDPHLGTMATELSVVLGARALVLNDLGRVMADSLDERSLCGEVLVLDELPEVLNGKPIWAVHEMASDNVLFCAVPVYSADTIAGAVLASVSLEPMFTALAQFKALLTKTAAVVIAVAFLGSLIAGLVIARPWSELVEVFEKAPTEDYSTDIGVRGSGDIARLAKAYNLMAERLRRTERVRRDFIVEAFLQIEQPLKSISELAEPDASDTIGRLHSIGQLAKAVSRDSEQLVELARLELQSEIAKTETVSLGDIIDDAIAVSRIGVGEEAPTVVREDSLGCGVRLKADRARLVKAVNNMIRFCFSLDDNRSTVGVAITEDSQHAFLAIRGAGAHIAPEDLPLIFERFLSRQKATTAEEVQKKPGSGLAFARRVVELHGGVLEAHSNPSGGVTFFARMPKVV